MDIKQSNKSISKTKEEKNEAESAKIKPTCLPIRYMVAFLAFIGFTFNYMLRVGIYYLNAQFDASRSLPYPR